jgi:hypothetical protein
MHRKAISGIFAGKFVSFFARRMSRKEPRLLPPVPFDELHWAEFPDRFNNRKIRHVTRSLADISFSSLRHQVYVISVAIRVEMKVPLTDAELSQLFGHTGGWAQGIISQYLQYLGSEKSIVRSGPIAAESDREQSLVQYCFSRQAENDPVTIQDRIDFMNQNGLQIDRFWVYRFINHLQSKLRDY